MQTKKNNKPKPLKLLFVISNPPKSGYSYPSNSYLSCIFEGPLPKLNDNIYHQIRRC